MRWFVSLLMGRGKKMKKWLIVSALLAVISLPIMGCATFGNGGWQNNISQLKIDINMFAKIATRIALAEAEMSAEDVELIREYLVALRDLLTVPGQPNFSGAKALAREMLSQKYQIYGLTIIDVIERYLHFADLNVNKDQRLIIALISSAIDGALEVVEEFSK